MTMRQRRKQFWWTWRMDMDLTMKTFYRSFRYGAGRIKHQHRDVT